jgi:FAD/FMN-containing dehydrogenase
MPQHAPQGRVLAFGHLGDGNLHYNVQFPAGIAPAILEQLKLTLTPRVHDVVVHYQGSISAEHGIGLAKAAEWERVGDAATRRLQRQIESKELE